LKPPELVLCDPIVINTIGDGLKNDAYDNDHASYNENHNEGKNAKGLVPSWVWYFH
jgi:hypothetical protein